MREIDTGILGASEVGANLYCNSRTSVLGRLRYYLQLLMKRSLSYLLLPLEAFTNKNDKIHRNIINPNHDRGKF